MDFIKRHKWEVPLYIIAAGLPLIIYFYTQYTGLEGMPWFPNQSTWSDFFLYGKSRCVHFCGLLMAVILIVGNIKKKNEKFEKEWIWILLFGVFQLISAFVSISPRQSFLGGIEQYESIWVLLGYLLIGCYAYQSVMRSKNPKSIFIALLLGAGLSCMIGITQVLQMDFWESALGKCLLVPQKYAELRENLRFNFSQGNWEPVYLASYNPNYAGIYLLMVLPLIIFLKNRKKKLAVILVGLCLVGTMSKTAMVSGVVVLGIGILLFSNKFSKINSKWMLGLAMVMLFLGILILELNHTEISVSSEKKLQEVVCGEEYIQLKYQGEVIRFRDRTAYQGGVTYEVLNEDGNKVKLQWNEDTGELEPQEENLQGLHFKVYEKDGISYAMFRYGDIPFRFTKDMGTGKYEYVSIYGKIDQIENAFTFLPGYESFLNGRGYIWGRVILQIIENPLFGTGPDTFLLAFPQDDYVERANLGHTFYSQILTNAHSFYLQMAMQTGLLSLISFLMFIICYLRKCLKLYWRREANSEMEKMGVCVLLGVIGYLLCGLTFASNVCTTPIFWLLLGTGIAINKIVMENKNQHLSV